MTARRTIVKSLLAASANRFTIADITALVAIDIGGRLAHIQIGPRLAHLTRWHGMVSGRASAKA
jgi:glutathione S-transferase